MNKELFIIAESLQNLLVAHATGSTENDSEYKEHRTKLLSNPATKEICPDFLKTNRNLSQFWQFIKGKFQHYSERKTFIWESFAPLLNSLEVNESSPSDKIISTKLKSVDDSFIHIEWEKALKRKDDDPEGAITSARTLIETVCKFVLDESKVIYEDTLDLPKLYKLTAKNLNLAPDQHLEPIFKQILGGCQAVVEGLGSMRNKLSDSHAKNRGQVRASERHAELAVNLAGAMSIFLLDTYYQRKH